jgi:hypothetical protein
MTVSLLTPARRFTCHGCGVIVKSDPIPFGWHQIRRWIGNAPPRLHGLFCTAKCAHRAAGVLALAEESAPSVSIPTEPVQAGPGVPRQYTCHACHVSKVSDHQPYRWFEIRRMAGERVPENLGWFCTALCLHRAVGVAAHREDEESHAIQEAALDQLADELEKRPHAGPGHRQ